jgi:hypothetical protein
MLSGSPGLPLAASQSIPISSIGPELLDASRPGWTINFLIFAGVYAVATVLWLFFDSTKPVVPPERESTPGHGPQVRSALPADVILDARS